MPASLHHYSSHHIYISINQQTASLLVSSCRTGHNRLDGELETSPCLPKTETFPESFRYAWKICDGDTITNIPNSNSMISSICTHEYEHIIAWNNGYSVSRWCCNRVKNNTHSIIPGFRMLAFKLWRGRVYSKTFESFLLSPTNPIFKNIQITHTSKTVIKSCLENFQINLKIN